jgi:hypothetical protein
LSPLPPHKSNIADKFFGNACYWETPIVYFSKPRLFYVGTYYSSGLNFWSYESMDYIIKAIPNTKDCLKHIN